MFATLRDLGRSLAAAEGITDPRVLLLDPLGGSYDRAIVLVFDAAGRF